MADSDGGVTAGATAYQTFRTLVEKADKNFAAVHDLPITTYVGGASVQAHYTYCYKKVFKAYTRLWRFQQEHRKELLESGMRRREIGEIASRIGQLYYDQYRRTSESRFLVEAYVFYEAVWSRKYFGEEDSRLKKKIISGSFRNQKAGKKEPDLGLRGKELRFYARFVVIALLLQRMEVVRQLVDKFRALLDDCKISFPGTNFKEWKQVLQEIARFLKADSCFPNSRPLRYNGVLDSYLSSRSSVARFHPTRVLKLQDAILTGYRRNEVKYAELTLDSFRMLQSLEWEPSGSFYQKGPMELNSSNGYSDVSGVSGLIDINLAVDMIDSSLPPNPYKAVLYRPSVPQLIAVIAAICESLSPDSILLIYISSSGRSEENNKSFLKDNIEALRNSNSSISSQSRDHCVTSPHDKDYSNDSPGDYLWLGSRGDNSMNKLYPADLISFTRKPLFLIIDSDNSNAFKILHGTEKGEAVALFLSPLKPVVPSISDWDITAKGSQFTFFLTAPLRAFCQLVGLSDIGLDTYNNTELALSTAFANWEVILCTSSSDLDHVWAQVFPDPFLRRLILRFVFCRSVLYLYNHPEKSPQHVPCCLPELPDSMSPDSSAVQTGICLVAESLGVVSQFCFNECIGGSSYSRSS